MRRSAKWGLLASPLIAMGLGCTYEVSEGPLGWSAGGSFGSTSIGEVPGADSGQVDGDESDGGGETVPETSESKGCGKVDFLFVIDNSDSMGEEQDNLTKSFSGFIETLGDELPSETDYHVMVVDSDGLASGPCEDRLGAGRRTSLDGELCLPHEHPPYLLASDPLAEEFPCIGLVGTEGEPQEELMRAMANAVAFGFNFSEGCNAGFMRDDAILVVVLITDEFAGDDVEGWRNVLVAAKDGNADAVVPLAIIGDTDTDDPICPPFQMFKNEGEAAPNPGLRELVESFEYGLAGSICAEDYGPFFAEAVSHIDAACESFVPYVG